MTSGVKYLTPEIDSSWILNTLQLKTIRKEKEMASHEELIKAGSFDDKFKNALRDYYTSDSKHMMIYSQKTKKENWNRLYLQLIQTGYA